MMTHPDAIDDLLERRAAGPRGEITENDLVMMDAQIDEQDQEIDKLENARFDALENAEDLHTLILEIDDDRERIIKLNEAIKKLIRANKYKPTTSCR